MQNIAAATATAAAAGLILMSVPHSLPISTGIEPGTFLAQEPATIANSGVLQVKFDSLAAEWRRETQFSSSVTDMVLHPAYQQIIGQGIAMVPFILRDLQKGPDHWYWALGAITQQNAAENASEGDIEAICEAWLDWGRKRGIIA
ncbi:MAG: hypothetical protein ACRECV_02455 [Xanthobacteraceae bacterium]